MDCGKDDLELRKRALKIVGRETGEPVECNQNSLSLGIAIPLISMDRSRNYEAR